MTRLHRFLNILICVGLISALAGCATTQITSTWKDPTYQGIPSKIMIVGMAKQQVNRRVFEDAFVSQFKVRGMDSLASYTVLPDALGVDHTALAAVVKQHGADALLISRLISRKTRHTYVPGTVEPMPGYYGRWPHYYGFGYDAMYTPGYVAEEEYAIAETSLFDVKTDKLIWTAASETEIEGADQQLINSFVHVMVETMITKGVLK